MRKYFYITLSSLLWIVMAIGFSDNWLTNINQPSNSEPKFLIHAVFAFSWFTLLVVQNGLIKKENIKAHIKTGKIGFLVFLGFLLSTLPLYLKEFEPLSIMVFSQLVLAIVLIGLAYRFRKKNPDLQKTNIMFGSFLLIQPAWDRAVGHLFGSIGLEWILFFLIIYGLFIWHDKKVRWQYVLGFIIWALGLVNVLRHMG